jgi:hypothetical protein
MTKRNSILFHIVSRLRDETKVLSPVDYEKLPSGTGVRWQNTAQWALFELVKQGLLKSDSPPGVWELSYKGIQQAEGTKS